MQVGEQPVEASYESLVLEGGVDAGTLPCEACNACGLCEISDNKIDFIGNINDPTNPPEVASMLRLAGFSTKVENWEAPEDKGRCEESDDDPWCIQKKRWVCLDTACVAALVFLDTPWISAELRPELCRYHVAEQNDEIVRIDPDIVAPVVSENRDEDHIVERQADLVLLHEYPQMQRSLLALRDRLYQETLLDLLIQIARVSLLLAVPYRLVQSTRRRL